MHEEHRPAFHAYRRFFVVCISMLMIIGGLLIWIWNGPGSVLVASAPAFAMERQDDGSWPAIPSDAPGFTWSLDVSKQVSKSEFKAIQMASATDSARIASRSIHVLNMSTGPLADLVVRGVIAGLQADSEIQRISYAPKNDITPAGEIAPDIVITIAVDDDEEDTMAGSGARNSKVAVTMSDQVARGITDTTSPNQAPHCVHFKMVLKSTTDIEQDGIATPNARLKATAKSLSNGILGHIRESIDKMRIKYGIFPELPATFYPNYVALDEAQFDVRTVFAENESFHQLSSWRDRLIHNRTWWHGRVAGNAGTAKARIGRRLQEAGFTPNNPTDRLDHTFSKGSIEVELINNETMPADAISSDDKPADNAMTKLYVCYTHRADEGMRLAALDSIITDSTSTDVLMICSPGWNKEQRLRGNALIETIDLQDPSHLMLRAGMRHRAENIEGAIDDLARAVTYAKSRFRHDKTLKNAREQAKKWGITFEDKLSDRDWLRGIGVTELVVDAEPIEFEVTPDKPFHGIAYIKGQMTTIAVGLKPSKQGQWGGALRVIGDMDSVQSGMSKGRSKRKIGEHTVTTEFLDDPSDGQSRVRLQIH